MNRRLALLILARASKYWSAFYPLSSPLAIHPPILSLTLRSPERTVLQPPDRESHPIVMAYNTLVPQTDATIWTESLSHMPTAAQSPTLSMLPCLSFKLLQTDPSPRNMLTAIASFCSSEPISQDSYAQILFRGH